MPGAWIGNLLTVRSPLVLRLDTTTTLTRPKARSDFHQSSSRCATPNSGCLADGRRERRQTRTKPLIESLKIWLEAQLARVPGRSEIAKDIRYGLSHWEGLIRVLGRRPHRDRLQYRRAIHQANCPQSQKRSLRRQQRRGNQLGNAASMSASASVPLTSRDWTVLFWWPNYAPSSGAEHADRASRPPQIRHNVIRGPWRERGVRAIKPGSDARRGETGYGLLEWPTLRRRLDCLPSYAD